MGFANGRPAILTGEQRRLLADLQTEFSGTLRQSLNAGERHRQAVEKKPSGPPSTSSSAPVGLWPWTR
ncbi:hypothetical protein ACFS3C_11925 [Azotobacter vinelandii]